MSNREKVLSFLARHPDRSYTPKQIARWVQVTERTALRHLEALVAAGHIHEEA